MKSNRSLTDIQCPKCAGELQKKLLLVDEEWDDTKGLDTRLKYCSDIRADWVKPELAKDVPLEQFIDGFYCANCDKGFLLDDDITQQWILLNKTW